jgi:hypothetical protein
MASLPKRNRTLRQDISPFARRRRHARAIVKQPVASRHVTHKILRLSKVATQDQCVVQFSYAGVFDFNVCLLEKGFVRGEEVVAPEVFEDEMEGEVVFVLYHEYMS